MYLIWFCEDNKRFKKLDTVFLLIDLRIDFNLNNYNIGPKIMIL